jgi:glucose-6-phosphate 1-epimerase
MTDSLGAIVAHCDFLTLTDNTQLYPNHPGSGLPLLHINTDQCQAVLALNGGQLLSFKPNGGDELLWVSPNCRFSAGTSLRGGIPLCLPWFGPHPSDPQQPNHGIARTQPWTLQAAQRDAQGRAVLTLGFTHRADASFDHDFSAELTLTLGASVSLCLTLNNHSNTAFNASWVMHTYFAVSDISQVTVDGLDGCQYTDKVAGGTRLTQQGPLTFAGEVDRVYEGVLHDISVSDATRRLAIKSQGCPSVVAWNTGATLAAQIADIGPDNHRGYACLERGACAGDAWRLPPGESQQAQMSITPTQ